MCGLRRWRRGCVRDVGSFYLAHMIDVSFTPFPFLTTENYALRNLMPEDAQEIFALRSSDEINKYLDRPKANTLDDARNFITKIIDGIAKERSDILGSDAKRRSEISW